MSFSLDLSRFKDLTEKKMEQAVKKTFIQLSTDIVRDTPVASGRLRFNWFPAINKFSESQSDYTDKRIGSAIAKFTAKANQYKLGDMITLSNNLPYAYDIEYGASKKKSPAGMVRINISRFNAMVKRNAK